MSLYKEWTDLMNSQTDETFEKFWEEYAGAEQRIYDSILTNYPEKFGGKLGELAEKFSARPVIFMGFCDGINTSLKTPNDLEKIDVDTDLAFDIDYDKLFFNMLKADADYLYNLASWDKVKTEEERIAIYKDFQRSKIVHVEKKPGRNDLCPCGSGKKYKKCCGR